MQMSCDCIETRHLIVFLKNLLVYVDDNTAYMLQVLGVSEYSDIWIAIYRCFVYVDVVL